jgi:hypothetical protein
MVNRESNRDKEIGSSDFGYSDRNLADFGCVVRGWNRPSSRTAVGHYVDGHERTRGLVFSLYSPSFSS